MRKPTESIPWLLLIALAAMLRLAPVASGLPYIDYVDEGYTLHQAIDLLNNRTVDPGWYVYPSLPPNLIAGALIAEGPIYRLVHGHSFRKDLPRAEGDTRQRDNYDLISPPELIVTGRLVVAGLSIGTVILAGAIATRLGGRRAGVIAMLITAVCPALVSRASNVIVDTFAAFFALLALYFCERMRTNTSAKVASVVIASIAAGLALASKYTAGAVFIAVLAMIFALPVSRSSRARFVLLASGGLSIGIAVGAPATIFKLPAVIRDMATISTHYRTLNSVPGYFGQAVSASELGWLLTIAGCVGIVFMFQLASTRSTALGWSLFAGLLLAVFVGKAFQPFRNLLPLVPLLCIAAAIAVSELIDWGSRGTYSWPRFGMAAALTGVCVVSLSFVSFRQVHRRITHRDTRLQAIDWLQQHASKEEKVLGIRELAILPAEWKRIAARPTVVPLTEVADLLEREQFDFVVTGEFNLQYAPDPDRFTASLARWKQMIAPFPVQADFGVVVTPVVPYIWRTNDERILILRKRDAGL